jgi:hypothetical protein
MRGLGAAAEANGRHWLLIVQLTLGHVCCPC